MPDDVPISTVVFSTPVVGVDQFGTLNADESAVPRPPSALIIAANVLTLSGHGEPPPRSPDFQRADTQEQLLKVSLDRLSRS